MAVIYCHHYCVWYFFSDEYLWKKTLLREERVFIFEPVQFYFIFRLFSGKLAKIIDRLASPPLGLVPPDLCPFVITNLQV